MKMKLSLGALALGLTALIGLPTAEFAAHPDGQSWSIAVHLAYQDGSEYDYVFATGVPTREVSSYLAECGASHRTGSVVRYHCYPIPE
ncbi:MAG TPA: hypothetical protein VFR18_27215 [Terriglobia bacterium]|nr:hypothetical protein [Terriglobia bacterium]